MKPIEDKCSSAPDMKVTCGRGGKADACHAQNLQDSLLAPDRDEAALTGGCVQIAYRKTLPRERLPSPALGSTGRLTRHPETIRLPSLSRSLRAVSETLRRRAPR